MKNKRQRKSKLRRFRSQSEARRVATQESKPIEPFVVDPEKGKVVNLEGRSHGQGGPQL